MPEIDFVIAWVDGTDPAHMEARRRFKMNAGGKIHSGATADARFRESGEIYYLIASILKYAPFVRRVHIVTDDQKPALLDSFAASRLCPPDFLKLVSHDVIFRGLDAARPTFNSLAIEAAIWRIPDLAEHFVYCNDDMFLNAPLTEEDFFHESRPVIRGLMMKPNRRRLSTMLRKLLPHTSGTTNIRPKYRIVQENAARLLGVTGNFLHVHHHPHPLRRSIIEKYYFDCPEILNSQVKYRFRNVSQYLPVALSNNLEAIGGTRFVKSQGTIAYMRPGKNSLKKAIDAIRNESTLFGCVQHLDSFPPDLQAQVHQVMQDKFRQVLPPVILQLIGRSEGKK